MFVKVALLIRSKYAPFCTLLVNWQFVTETLSSPVLPTAALMSNPNWLALNTQPVIVSPFRLTSEVGIRNPLVFDETVLLSISMACPEAGRMGGGAGHRGGRA